MQCSAAGITQRLQCPEIHPNSDSCTCPVPLLQVFTPIYPPFLSAPEYTDRTLVTVPLVRGTVPAPETSHGTSPGTENRLAATYEDWTFDWDAMAAEVAKRPDIGVLLLCNPHNPVGRIFSHAELQRLGEFCDEHGIIICSDEIHCDLLLEEGVKHWPMAAVDGGRFASRTITVNAPSKVRADPGIVYRRHACLMSHRPAVVDGRFASRTNKSTQQGERRCSSLYDNQVKHLQHSELYVVRLLRTAVKFLAAADGLFVSRTITVNTPSKVRCDALRCMIINSKICNTVGYML